MVGIVIPGPPPVEVEQLLDRRHQLGLDHRDEVWEGVLHMTPYAHFRHSQVESEIHRVLGPIVRETRASGGTLIMTGPFNLGDGPQSFRVPDFGVHGGPASTLYVPTALLVGEVLSPYDETYAKIGYYADHGVQELMIVDPDHRRVDVRWLPLDATISHSQVLDISAAWLADHIDWPAL